MDHNRRCISCRSFEVSQQIAKRRRHHQTGHCRRDGNPAHPGYVCDHHVHSLAALTAIFEMSAEELAWLRGHEADEATMTLRGALQAVQDANADEAARQRFRVQLATWRATTGPVLGEAVSTH